MPDAAYRRRPRASPIVTLFKPERGDDDNETEKRRHPCYRATVSAQLEMSVSVPNLPRR